MKADSSGPVCPRCGGPAALSPERLEELALESPMPASLRAGESLLRRRLARCSSCGGLREQVLCAYCGCFVRFRADVLKSWCPSPAGDKWAGFPESALPGDTPGAPRGRKNSGPRVGVAENPLAGLELGGAASKKAPLWRNFLALWNQRRSPFLVF